MLALAVVAHLGTDLAKDGAFFHGGTREVAVRSVLQSKSPSFFPCGTSIAKGLSVSECFSLLPQEVLFLIIQTHNSRECDINQPNKENKFITISLRTPSLSHFISQKNREANPEASSQGKGWVEKEEKCKGGDGPPEAFMPSLKAQQ